MRKKIATFYLKALLALDGQPMSQEDLITAAQASIQPRQLESDLRAGIYALESGGYIIGTDDDISGRMWKLTTAGTLKAKELL